MDLPHSANVQTELWTSWASVLRSYAAMHGLSATHHAVVEVSPDSITVRADTRWLRFTPSTVESSTGGIHSFALLDDGTVRVEDETEPMDLAAESLTRTLLHPEG